MDEQAFEELEARLWTDPDQLTDEELDQLLQACLQKEGENTDENYATSLLSA